MSTAPNTPVEILHPNHLLFNVPNKISQKDFNGWMGERGLYFWKEWNQNYLSLLSSFDAGEAKQLGGMLLCNYGQGSYLYIAYSLFHQIPASIHGALNLFANILATPRHRILARIDLLKKIPIFMTLHENHLEQIAKKIVEHYFPSNTYICHEGDTTNALYIIIEGKVDVIKETKTRSRIVDQRKVGDCIGEFAILADLPRTATLKANGPVRLLTIEGASFQQLLTQFSEIRKQIIKQLVHKILQNSNHP